MRLAPYQPKKPRIEIIPMIDTMFFLLVFFMISSLAMTTMKGMPVNLPASATADTRPVEQVVLTLTEEGAYFIDKERVEFEQIGPHLSELIEKNPDIAVIINCDREQSVAGLVALADEAKRSGARLLTIATEPRQAQAN